jgi:hypothetical protein
MVMTPEEVEIAFGWLPPEAVTAYLDAYVESGDDTVAWAQVRQDPRYAQWFPGNLTEDGRPRYSEDVYAAVVASYDDVFRSVGIDGVALNEMREQYGNLIAGDVSPQELEANRVAPMYDRIVLASDAIRSYYASEFGVELGLTDLIASAMNPDLGNKVLTKQISLAEIGGEAAESGYDLGSETIGKLFESGKVDREAADRLFQSAENLLPTLNVLAARHADPDDEFDINEFIQADIFQNPEQRRRMNRLVAQERSTFTGGGQTDYLRDQRSGGVAGLGRS